MFNYSRIVFDLSMWYTIWKNHLEWVTFHRGQNLWAAVVKISTLHIANTSHYKKCFTFCGRRIHSISILGYQKIHGYHYTYPWFFMSFFNNPYKCGYPHWYPSRDIHAKTFCYGYPQTINIHEWISMFYGYQYSIIHDVMDIRLDIDGSLWISMHYDAMNFRSTGFKFLNLFHSYKIIYKNSLLHTSFSTSLKPSSEAISKHTFTWFWGTAFYKNKKIFKQVLIEKLTLVQLGFSCKFRSLSFAFVSQERTFTDALHFRGASGPISMLTCHTFGANWNKDDKGTRARRNYELRLN